MSNDIHAYGWSGHILLSDAEHEKERAHRKEGVVVIPDMAFQSLIRAMDNCKLDKRINVERLGVTTSEYYFLATGHPSTFATGYTYYGAPFENAEDRVEGGNAVDPKQRDTEYLEAMKAVYNLNLPPCRLMVGASVEH